MCAGIGERGDAFIGNHTRNNDTCGKYETLVETGRNEFIGGELRPRFLREYRARLQRMIEAE